MNKLSDTEKESARKNEAIIMQALARDGQTPVAEAIGCDISTISRWQSSGLAMCCKVLAILGLKVVPAGTQLLPPGHVAVDKGFAVAAWYAMKQGAKWQRRELEKAGCKFYD